jgi:hypothetical protein
MGVVGQKIFAPQLFIAYPRPAEIMAQVTSFFPATKAKATTDTKALNKPASATASPGEKTTWRDKASHAWGDRYTVV